MMTPNFEQTIQQNVNILHKLCRVYLNDETEYKELFQDMLIQIWRALPQFRGEAQISTWLYRVCINTALGYRTRAKKISGKFVPLEETLPARFSFDGDEKDEQSNRLYRAVRELKPIDRAIVSLYLDEKSHDETAQILGITKTNVATRLMRLKKQLIEKLSVYE
jgi:RNA polymerase sigma-70 factor (ECF subfamily)